MDEKLRNGLWNAVYTTFFASVNAYEWFKYSSDTRELRNFIMFLWTEFFGKQLDHKPSSWDDYVKFVRNFFSNSKFYDVYDFIEFCANEYKDEDKIEYFKTRCNLVLEKERAAYRFVGDFLTHVTSDTECDEIENALNSPELVSKHLNEALRLYADRQEPDYRLSVKESLTAVEGMVSVLCGKPTALASLEKIPNQFDFNLFQSVLVTSSLRMLKEISISINSMESTLHDKVESEDALIVLVTSSTMINFLKGKLSKVRAT